MAMKALSISVLAVLLSCVNSSTTPVPEEQNRVRFWAAISVNEPVFISGWTNNLQIYFALVNDSNITANPEIESSQIIVNGKAWSDSGFIFSNGIRHDRFTALPPKDYLLFTYALGDRFNEPGIYKVVWKGKAFESPEIVFRVLPKKQK
jgi:hypothetical protein